MLVLRHNPLLYQLSLLVVCLTQRVFWRCKHPLLLLSSLRIILSYRGEWRVSHNDGGWLWSCSDWGWLWSSSCVWLLISLLERVFVIFFLRSRINRIVLMRILALLSALAFHNQLVSWLLGILLQTKHRLNSRLVVRPWVCLQTSLHY